MVCICWHRLDPIWTLMLVDTLDWQMFSQPHLEDAEGRIGA